MRRGLLLISMALLVAGVGGAHAGATCQMLELGELPVTLGGGNVSVEAQVNGHPVRLIIDTGSAATLLTRPVAQQLALPLRPITGLELYGVGGTDQGASARIKEFKVATLVANDFDMLVVGRHELGAAQGVLGAGFLMQVDVEFDFPDGKLRFFKPRNCQGNQVVYWGAAYSVAPMVGPADQRIDVTVFLNGKPVTAEMDTGSGSSIVNTAEAANAGVKPAKDAALETPLRGLGGNLVPAYRGTFASFGFGDETIHNARMLVADMFGDDKEAGINTRIATVASDAPEMLLGEDFFRSHRVYVSLGQRKVYVSYVGGPVFTTPEPAATDNSDTNPCPGVDLDASIRACTALIMSDHGTIPNLASIYVARGVDYRNKLQFDQALADFAKALELNPKDADAVFESGVVYEWKKQKDEAIAQYSRAIALNPDLIGPYNMRGVAYASKGMHDQAIDDFTKSLALKPDVAEVLYDRGRSYLEKARRAPRASSETRGLLDRAIADFDQAIRLRPDDVDTLDVRANAFVAAGFFDKAQADFDRAVKLRPASGAAFRSRGWNEFELGRFADAAADFSTAIRLEPTDAYGVLWRNIALSRLGQPDAAGLRTAASGISPGKWPRPLIDLFLGASSPADLRAASKAGDPDSLADQACEAAFYAGEYALLHGDQAGAKSLFTQAADSCPMADIEAIAAERELHRLP